MDKPALQAKARMIAFYLPQFHPIPENDRWWGKNFTEWVAVKQAQPLFPGHRQPRRPGTLGYYDLRDEATRQKQADLARQNGIEAFCYWHYWFGEGRQLLERPFNEVLKSGQPNFPFCLGWANHSWEARFFNAGGRCLMKQTYPGPQDHARHFEWALPAFEDPRYLRVDDKPLFYVYDPREIPECRKFTDQWRALAQKAGLKGLYFVGRRLNQERVRPYGFDAGTRGLAALSVHIEANRKAPLDKKQQPLVINYETIANEELELPLGPDQVPVFLTNWDTTPRHRKNGEALIKRTPENYKQYLRALIQAVQYRPAQERLIFVKSWNEWAEGNYLEPDADDNLTYLHAFAQEVLNNGTPWAKDR